MKTNIKQITLCIAAVLAVGMIGLCGYAVVDYFNYAAVNVQQEHPTPVPQDNVLPYKIHYDNYANTAMITAYTGKDTEITLPSSLSIGERVGYDYTFTERYELDEYIMETSDYYHNLHAGEKDIFNKDIFNLVFVDQSGAEHRCTTLRQLDDLRMGEGITYPVTHTGKKQLYIIGEDIPITRCFGLNETVEKVTVPASYTEVGYSNLARQGIVIEFTQDNETYGTWKYENNTIIDIATNELKCVYPAAMDANGVINISGVKIVDIYAFETFSYSDLVVKTINIAEGVTKVYNSANLVLNFAGENNTVIYLPTTLTDMSSFCIYGTCYLMFRNYPTSDSTTQLDYVIFYQGQQVYVFPDEIYNQIIAEFTQYANMSEGTVGYGRLISLSAYNAL